MAKQGKDACPKCGKSNYAVAEDKSGKQYCQTKGCQNVWVPGLDQNMSRGDLVLRQAQKEATELRAEITRVRQENSVLREKLAKYEPVTEPIAELTEEEILS